MSDDLFRALHVIEHVEMLLTRMIVDGDLDGSMTVEALRGELLELVSAVNDFRSGSDSHALSPEMN